MNWKHEINIQPILIDEDTSLAEKAALLRSALMIPPFSDIESERNVLTFVTNLLEDAGELDDVEVFDEGLQNLYNWADLRSVWLGI